MKVLWTDKKQITVIIRSASQKGAITGAIREAFVTDPTKSIRSITIVQIMDHQPAKYTW
jgi:hypothetical protein